MIKVIVPAVLKAWTLLLVLISMELAVCLKIVDIQTLA